MSKTNLRNKSIVTVLVGCEGVTEVNFFKRLKSIFQLRNCGYSFKEITLGGGSMTKQLEEIKNHNIAQLEKLKEKSVIYDKLIWLTDGDLYDVEEYNKWCKSNKKLKEKFVLEVVFLPKIEGLYLDFTHNKIGKNPKQQCEKLFGQKYTICCDTIFKEVDEIRNFVDDKNNQKYKNYNNIQTIHSYFKSLKSN